MPRVSVAMTVYNCEKFIKQSVESILAQTYSDFEFIIVCESGTNDETLGILNDFAKLDSRIRLIKNSEKLGIAPSLNKALREASGEYIARMDGDDVAMQNRLAAQVEFMDEKPDTAICCSRVIYIDENGKELYYKDNLSDNPEQIKSDLLFFCFIHHSSVMFRKTAVVKHNLYYDETFKTAEDHELWRRASRLVKISAVPEILLKYRWHANSAAHSNADQQRNDSLRIMRNCLSEMQIAATDAELRYLQRTTCRETLKDFRKVERILNAFYNTIIEKSRELNIYDEECLNATLSRRMYWRQHRIRRLAAVMLKSVASATSSEHLFASAIYLELNGFSAVIKRILRWR